MSANGNVGAAQVFSAGNSAQWGVWRPATGVVALGLPPGQSDGRAIGISGDGVTLVGFATPLNNASPFRWNAASGFSVLPMPVPYSSAYPLLANFNASVVAGIAYEPTTGESNRPVVVWSGGAVTTLPILASSTAEPTAMTPDGRWIVGESFYRAFLWNADAGMIDIGASPQALCDGNRAIGVNDAGTQVVAVCDLFNAPTPSEGRRPWRWNGASGSVLQPVAGETVEYVSGAAANATILYGRARFPGDSEGRAALWIGDQPAISLASFLTSRGVDLAGWRLDGVAVMSAGGSTLVGPGNYLGQDVQFVVTNLPLCPTVFTTQPQPTLAQVGATVTLSVGVSSCNPASAWRWRRNGIPLVNGPTPSASVISGADTPTITITNVQHADAGRYSCVATNPLGDVSSTGAPLVVNSGCGEITDEIPAGASCTPLGQACDSIPFFTRSTCGTLRAQYIASPTHCSDVGIYFFLDDLGEVASTPALAAGDASPVVDLGPVAAGTHRVGMQGFGVIGGCNVGYLQAWSGTLRLSYCVQTPVITNQPRSTHFVAGVARATVRAPVGGPPLLDWQYEQPGSPGTWISIGDGETRNADGLTIFTASGAGSEELAIVQREAFSALFPSSTVTLRCVVSNLCGSVTSNSILLSSCAADYNADGFLTFEDFDDFVNDFESGVPAADFNADGFLTFEDFDAFVAAFEAGC
ncbi:MAG: immunoglobulin domain-containing protein [Planctomycetota bacterium]|nr:immunoglobulin domain-containing protein [Planctomycetota bacterium]